MQKITPHLWFDKEVEEAAQFYTTVFAGGKILETTHYPEAGFEIHHQKAGSVMTVVFELEGYTFMGINAGPIFKFNPSISFMVYCTSKDEVNELWKKLSDGGTPLMPIDSYPFSERYGWIQDKFGVTWQIIHSDQKKQNKIIPALMYAGDNYGKAEEAMNLYTKVFSNSAINTIAKYPAGTGQQKEGTVMYGEFTLENQTFATMDSEGEHKFTFNEAISLLVTCKDQEEIDTLWNALAADPTQGQCGWLKDRFGVSWQIAPSGMEEMLNSPDKEKANRAMNAMLQMKKIDIAQIKKAYEGEG